jgi:hypothetical protein
MASDIEIVVASVEVGNRAVRNFAAIRMKLTETLLCNVTHVKLQRPTELLFFQV